MIVDQDHLTDLGSPSGKFSVQVVNVSPNPIFSQLLNNLMDGSLILPQDLIHGLGHC